MAMYLEFLVFGLLFLALILGSRLIILIGRGMLNIIFVSFTAGVLFLGASRLFLYLADSGVFQLSDVTLHVWWHIIFYLSMISFIWGGIRLKEISSTSSGIGFSSKDKMLFSIMGIITIAIYLISSTLEPVLSPLLTGSIIDTFGLHHFVAMILGLIAASYMYYIQKNWGKMLSMSVVPMVAFLALMGLQHFWELLTESWKVVALQSETIELVEQFIVIPALVFLVFAFLRVTQFIKSSATQNKL